MYNSGDEDTRLGPFDAGASPGDRSTGYTLAGVGWYRKKFSVESVKTSDTKIVFQAKKMSFQLLETEF